MNAENFAAYLGNPTLLYQISYQELKSLVLDYPYCQNLRYLLLLKSQIDQHQDFERNLEKAAAYSFDRSFLFQQFKNQLTPLPPVEVEEENFVLQEDVLELKELNAQEEEELVEQHILNELKAQHQSEEERYQELFAGPATSSENLEEEELELSDLQLGQAAPEEPLVLPEAPKAVSTEILPPTLAVQLSTMHRSIHQWLQKHRAAQVRMGEENAKTETPTAVKRPSAKPLPKKAFKATKKIKTPSKLKLADVADENKKKKKKKTKAVIAFAERSVKDNQNIASETLAQLLVEQGLNDKAIEIYERLILLFPNKGDTYLEKITQLKSEL